MLICLIPFIFRLLVAGPASRVERILLWPERIFVSSVLMVSDLSRISNSRAASNYIVLGYVSNYFKDTCIKIEPTTISWLNPWAFFPLLLSTVGIILTLEVS